MRDLMKFARILLYSLVSLASGARRNSAGSVQGPHVETGRANGASGLVWNANSSDVGLVLARLGSHRADCGCAREVDRARNA
jgi:hypothetical protein